MKALTCDVEPPCGVLWRGVGCAGAGAFEKGSACVRALLHCERCAYAVRERFWWTTCVKYEE